MGCNRVFYGTVTVRENDADFILCFGNAALSASTPDLLLPARVMTPLFDCINFFSRFAEYPSNVFGTLAIADKYIHTKTHK